MSLKNVKKSLKEKVKENANKMKIKFNKRINESYDDVKILEFSCDNDLSKYVDSMLFPSGKEIAHMRCSGNGSTVDMCLEVRGEVNVEFEGETYRDPVDFPEELKDIIKNNGLFDDERLYVDANNWFEYIYTIDNIWSDGIMCEIDISICTQEDIKKEMYEWCCYLLNKDNYKFDDLPETMKELKEGSRSKVEMDFYKMEDLFTKATENGLEPVKGYIVFTEDSFNKPYSEEARTYEVSSGCKRFNPKMIGTSIFGSCIDGTDNGVRLDWYMWEDNNPWKVEKCYVSKEDYDKITSIKEAKSKFPMKKDCDLKEEYNHTNVHDFIDTIKKDVTSFEHMEDPETTDADWLEVFYNHLWKVVELVEDGGLTINDHYDESKDCCDKSLKESDDEEDKLNEKSINFVMKKLSKAIKDKGISNSIRPVQEEKNTFKVVMWVSGSSFAKKVAVGYNDDAGYYFKYNDKKVSADETDVVAKDFASIAKKIH